MLGGTSGVVRNMGRIGAGDGGIVKTNPTKLEAVLLRIARMGLAIAVMSLPLCGQPISLQALVTPSTIISTKDGQPLKFAVHGFIEFNSLSELFPYIDSQTERWNVPGGIHIDEEQRRQLASDLLRRGIESRVVSMLDERPLETLTTHTSDELRQALSQSRSLCLPAMLTRFWRCRKNGSNL